MVISRGGLGADEGQCLGEGGHRGAFDEYAEAADREFVFHTYTNLNGRTDSHMLGYT